jgi:5-oxopent-3-ene-1,2,5-tricarboxylate decarboxylase/2-hydroxyhepta-2,4-diene-1,7-dioate isomerase
MSGTVVGALVNHGAELAALGDAVAQPPYKAAPRAPVLQVKPRHTLVRSGAAVALPAAADGGAGSVVVGATLAIVIGRTACRVAAAGALAHVAGYGVACDLHLPLPGPHLHYRPAVRQRARDGFCPLGLAFAPAAAVPRPDALAVRIALDGCVAQATDTAGRVRGVAALIADVSAFMTLQPGDVLLLGASHGAPLARAGQQVHIGIDGVGTLDFGLVPEEPVESAP